MVASSHYFLTKNNVYGTINIIHPTNPYERLSVRFRVSDSAQIYFSFAESLVNKFHEA